MELTITIKTKEHLQRRQINNILAAAENKIHDVILDERYGDNFIIDIKEFGVWAELEIKIWNPKQD